jgi:hypothetical protein
MPARNKKSKKAAGKSVLSQPGSTNISNNAPLSRLLFKVAITEAQAIPWSVKWFPLRCQTSDHSQLANWTSFRVKRAGIEIPPRSYVEFIVREEAIPSLDSRGELVLQEDCQFHYAVTPGTKRYWYTPGEAIYRGWQDGLTINSGLYLALVGNNGLTPGADGILCNIVIDLELKGAITFTIGRTLTCKPLTFEATDVGSESSATVATASQ